jgi:succinate dehydrogenase hydrophobic anchor subunit
MMMGSLVAVGLALLLLWRLLLFMYDRKEYAKFINESQNAKWTAVSLLKLRKTKTIIKNDLFFLPSG